MYLYACKYLMFCTALRAATFPLASQALLTASKIAAGIWMRSIASLMLVISGCSEVLIVVTMDCEDTEMKLDRNSCFTCSQKFMCATIVASS